MHQQHIAMNKAQLREGAASPVGGELRPYRRIVRAVFPPNLEVRRWPLCAQASRPAQQLNHIRRDVAALVAALALHRLAHQRVVLLDDKRLRVDFVSFLKVQAQHREAL